MAPGGFSKVILDRYKNTHIYGLSLPPSQGGHPLIESPFNGCLQDRFEIQYLDITMLSDEFRTGILSEHSNLSTKRPYNDIKFDLVIADGAVLESHERSQYRTKVVEGLRLRASELVLALQRIKSRGTFVMLLHHMNTWETVQILHDFQSFATVQVKKPTTSHKASSSFYMIAEDVRPTDAAAMAFVAKWKKTWTVATFEIDKSGDKVDAIDSVPASLDIHSVKTTDGEVRGLLEAFGPTLIEMGTPVWETQMEGLHRKTGGNSYGSRPEKSLRSMNEGIWVRGGRQDSFNVGNFAEFQTQAVHIEAQHRDSLRSDDRSTAASWTSRSSTSESTKGQAIRGNWNVQKASDLAREAEAKKEREDARCASAAKIQAIRGKSSWRSRETSDEDKVDTAGLVERAGNANVRARE
jgi:23S rRNA U2552 (ribose-2'-O)-methylase RlmE/FtsJ